MQETTSKKRFIFLASCWGLIMENNNTIQTVGELVAYLQTLDQDKPIIAEYIKVVGSQYIGLEHRPLLKTLIEDDGDYYEWIGMFY